MKERKVGEVFDVNGLVLQVQKGDYCKDSFFFIKRDSLSCLRNCRFDKDGLIFKQLETTDINYKIYVMQQFRDGEEIEFTRVGSDIWDDSILPGWNWNNFVYRLKLKKKYRPYTDSELFELEIGRKIKIKVDSMIYEIVTINKNNKGYFVIAYRCAYVEYNAKELLDKATWEDGSPCGVEVEE